MFIKKEPYFTKEVETEHPEPHSWDCSEHGLWAYNLMHGFKNNKDSNFDAAFKEAVKMLERGNQMENQLQNENTNSEFQLLKAMRGVRNAVTIVKDATNPHFKSGYAKLDQIVAKLDTAVEQYGLEYNQRCEKETIFTKVLHQDGFSVVTESPVLNKKGDSQGYGSGQTYAMRYGLCMAFGIAPTDDDDGNAAAARPVNNNTERPALNLNQELNPGDYVIQVGFKKGEKLSSLSENELMQQYEFWSTKNSQGAKEFIAAISNYKNDKMKR